MRDSETFGQNIHLCAVSKVILYHSYIHLAIQILQHVYISILNLLNFKAIYYSPIEITKELTDMGQFQYLTKLKGPQVGNYLYTHNFFH